MNLAGRTIEPSRRANARDTVASYLCDALETADASVIADALGVIARTRGILLVARDAGLPRETLYRTLSSDGDPSLSTVLKTMQALGLKLAAVPAD